MSWGKRGKGSGVLAGDLITSQILNSEEYFQKVRSIGTFVPFSGRLHIAIQQVLLHNPRAKLWVTG